MRSPRPHRADLHTHTTASDGRLDPVALVQKAHRAGLEALAITDHDSVDGYHAARAEAEALGITLVPGVELAAWVPTPRRLEGVHLLGYGFDPDTPVLKRAFARFRAERVTRAQRMVEKLAAAGAPVSFERVQAIAGDGVIARPHLAEALVEAGHVPTPGQAFAQYLGRDGAAFVPKNEAGPEETIGLVHEAGGLAVLAHPGPYLSPAVFRALLKAGLDGVEVVHPSHGLGVERYWRATAQRHGLIMTGGSDYHGRKPVEAERFGQMTVPLAWAERLLAPRAEASLQGAA